MRGGIIGSGTWATALVKLLNDNGQHIHWWVRGKESADYILQRKHNPRYLSSVLLNTSLLKISNNLQEVIENSDYIVFAIPSAYIPEILQGLPPDSFKNKLIVSAIKGLIPYKNMLFNEFLSEKFGYSQQQYYTIMGPCHAEEIASEKLSILTFSGNNTNIAQQLAGYFHTPYLSTRVNNDITGVQYAAILKNVYALGAGIAHGLKYGDNFQSVYIANAASELFRFLEKAAHLNDTSAKLTSPYLGDLLVTCYSLFSRNRTFGNMIGKGYSAQAAGLELNMVAEGYNASKAIYEINRVHAVNLPIATTIYNILWENKNAAAGFQMLEEKLL